ncbi:hypothetical protein RB595_003718 [Gaeumannomyces hyphopodioides]
MTSVANPTYLLAPNWNFPFDGPIALGNIVGDPFRPHRSLSKPAADAPAPATITSVESNRHLELERIRRVNLNMWAKISELARFDIGVHRTKATTVALEMLQLDTIYFRDEPSADDIATRAREPRVRTVLETRKWGRRGTVYMVSGLKVARGFKLDRMASSGNVVRLGAGGEVAPGVSAGAELELGARTRRAEGFEAANDIIFAYQLLRIRLKGRGENATLELDEFQHDAQLLTGDGEEGEEKMEADGQVDLETDGASLVELAETQKGLIVNPDEDQYAWLFPSK